MAQQGKQKLNCWEFMKCGREKGGEKTQELGICPAFTEKALHHMHDGQHGGRACWVMEGTLCAASVQGPFVEKFKKCIRCAFFHYVEAQEGKKLKNANDLLQMVATGKTGKKTCQAQDCQGKLAVCKGCGQELRVTMDPNWQINIVGIIEFKCRNCGQIVRTRGMLAEEADETITLHAR